MQIITNIDTPLPSHEKPIALTIGNFDGIHLGHQAVIKQMSDTGAKQLVLMSYSNNPAEVLGYKRPTTLICSEEHKKRLLKNLGISTFYNVPFTQDFANQTPRQFLERIRKSIPFDFLVLGEDARLGKDREGTPEVILKLSKELGFEAIYVPDFIKDGERLSSSRVRLLLQQGNFKKVSEYLGRPYSIIWGDVDRLCLPPRNYYPCQFAGMKATAKVSHAGLEVNPSPSVGIEVKFIS